MEQVKLFSTEDNFLLDQGPEISVGGNADWFKRFCTFPVLQSRNLGNFKTGFITRLLDISRTQTINDSINLFFEFVVFLNHNKSRRSYREYKIMNIDTG